MPMVTEVELFPTVEAFRQLVNMHHPEPQRATYGRRPQVEMCCVICNQPAPCPTRQIAQTELGRLTS